MKKILTFLLIALTLLFTSCTNDIEEPDDTWASLFQKFWDAMNTEYVHFSDESEIDWDDVYEEYLPKFDCLDFSSTDDTITAFRYFKEILWDIKDYHYRLTVYDINGNKLSLSPAMLQKWVEGDSSRDIMEYPDLVLEDNDGNQYYASVKYNKEEEAYSQDEVDKYKREAVESCFEVEDLTSSGAFHTISGNVKQDYKVSYGNSISKITSEEGLSDKEISLADEWNELLELEGISSSLDYFYGVTEDNIFYFYFSSFLGPDFLDELITKDTLSPEERKQVNANEALKEFRDVVQQFNNESYGLIYEKFKALQGFTEMFNCIKAVASDGVLKVKGEMVEIKGIVMDLRGNGGGYNYFLNSLMSSFFPDEIVFGSSRYKDGYSRLEYTPWMDVYLEKTDVSGEVEKVYDKPFAVLVNGSSASCSELATIIAKNHLPYCCVIGKTTFGATCTLSDRTVYNSGTFESAYFTTKTTTYQFRDSCGMSYETTGITPDYMTELSREKDNAFIKAIEWIKSR